MPKITSKLSNFLLMIMMLFQQLLGYSGLMLIFFGAFNQATGRWGEFVDFANFTSVTLTLIGVVLTAGSVYAKQTPNPPFAVGKLVAAPIVILLALAAAVYWIMQGSLSFHIVNGFALLAISGSLMRTYPKPNNWGPKNT